jgi:predicted Zn-dependent peptidase
MTPGADAASTTPHTSAAAPATNGRLDRSRPPRIGPTPALRLPAAERLRLSNGARVVLIGHHKTPTVNIGLVFPRGSAADPAGKAGLASLTASMLDEGTARHTALELADRLDFLGASVGAGSGWDASFAGMSCLTRHLEAVADLFAEVVLAPALAEKEWARIRKQRLDGLLSASDQPTSLAAWAFDSTLFPGGHPYGLPAGGTPATVAALSLEDIRAFHAANFRPEGATFIVVGDVTAERVVPVLEERFRGWTGGDPAAFDPPEPRPRAGGTAVTVVDKPGASQSVLRIGHVGLPRAHPDYFPVRVMNTLLGGHFAGRINRNLRETKGFTYGAGSSFDFRRRAGPFAVSASVHTKDTAAAVTEVVRELRDISGPRPPSPEETAAAVNFMTRGYVRQFETPRQIGDNWSALVMHGLSDDFFNTWVDRVAAVDAAEAARVAAAHIRPDALDIVLAGDATAVVGPLERLGLGPVRVIRKEQVFG